METHDTGVVDGDTGLIVGGDDLDEDFNRRILQGGQEKEGLNLKPKESNYTCFECHMTYHCDCQLEAKIVEHHDNYRRRYACCPKQDDYACGYFKEVDPQYPNRAMEVIDDLVAPMREAHDVMLEERNNQYWLEEEDRAVEDGMRAELDELKGVIGVAFAAIMVLVAALLVFGVKSSVVVR
ncbi:hypothetical protein Cgig2_007080 [Carnegiea gigantea]|uniref:Uncharacterized protein n=1 Tax=Carnegiea gigantea TaxID=171969 RepID=A0A9Q1GQQ1_9CARY|nr:hypothetical protein Cgig2_007080 [Carnegiea gigantea]